MCRAAGGCKASWEWMDESRGNQTRWWQGHGCTRGLPVDKAITYPVGEQYTYTLHNAHLSCTKGKARASVSYALYFRFCNRSHQLFLFKSVYDLKNAAWSDMLLISSSEQASVLLSEGFYNICQGIKSNPDMSQPDNNEVKMSFRQIIGHVLALYSHQSIMLQPWCTEQDICAVSINQRKTGGVVDMLEGERFGKFRRAQMHGNNMQMAPICRLQQ